MLGCPLKHIDAPTWQAMRLIGWADNGGHLPVAGGVLDQTVSFMDVLREVRAERSRIDSDKRK